MEAGKRDPGNEVECGSAHIFLSQADRKPLLWKSVTFTLGLKLLFPLKSLVITFLISFLVETSKIWVSRGTVYGEKEADGLMLNSDLQIGVY